MKHFNLDLPHKKGCDLTKSEQQHVLSAFVHRFTKDHIPTWSRQKRPDGNDYKPQFASDQDWLNNTFFQVTPKKGNLCKSTKSCYSNPTWPDGQ